MQIEQRFKLERHFQKNIKDSFSQVVVNFNVFVSRLRKT
jgi:hypothetical protein